MDTVSLINTGEEINNDFYVGIFHEDTLEVINNSTEKEKILKGLKQLKRNIDKGIFPKSALNGRPTILTKYLLKEAELLEEDNYLSNHTVLIDEVNEPEKRQSLEGFEGRISNEYDFEKIRKDIDLNYPSRCACFFVFEKLEDLYNYCEKHNHTPEFIANIEVDKSKNHALIKADLEIYSCYAGKSEITPPLEKYWRGEIGAFKYSGGIYIPITEILIEGEVKIKKTMDY